MLDFMIDLGCIAFVLLTGMFCISWVFLRRALPWRSHRKWMGPLFYTVAIIIGAWHLLYGVLKLVYLILWTVTT